MKRVGIIQSNYIPWKGYFDFVASVDAFVLLDDVQYTKRDWRNRNKIKTREGTRWLTLPVNVTGKYHQAINEVTVAGSAWVDEHLNAFRHEYGKAKCYRETMVWLEPLYRSLAAERHLTRINELIIRKVCSQLGVATPITRSTDFELTTGKNERLIAICQQLGATHYLSGPAARDYMDMAEWSAAGIQVEFKTYGPYPVYEQMYPPFEHAVTVLDLFFNLGESAQHYVREGA